MELITTQIPEMSTVTDTSEGDGSYRMILLTIIYTIIMILILTGNLLVVLTIILHKSMWTATSIFIFSLSVADLLVGCFVIPATVSILDSSRQPGFVQCTLLPYLQLLSVTASIATMVGICFERYRVIVLQKQIWSRQLAVKIAMVTWAMSAIYSCRLFLQMYISKKHWDELHPNPVEDDAITLKPVKEEVFCSLFVEDDTSDLLFRAVDFLAIFMLPMVVMTLMYSIIVRKLWAPNQAASSQTVAKKRRIVLMCMTVLASFFVFWLPWHLTDIIIDTREVFNKQRMEEEGDEEEEEEDDLSKSISLFTTMLALANSFVNPIIYMIFNATFKKQVVEILRGNYWKKRSEVAPSTAVMNSPNNAVV